MKTKKIAIFASGSGSNAQKIVEYFTDHKEITIDSIWCNKEGAYVLERAKELQVEAFLFNREEFVHSLSVVEKLKSRQIDLIVLAGFLWLVPTSLIENFTIINIHPALLPKYGGKGMYGMNVHKAVVENGDKESGISIHYVNEKYDDGKLIFQAKCKINDADTPQDVANKVHELEYKHFPPIIEQVALNLK